MSSVAMAGQVKRGIFRCSDFNSVCGRCQEEHGLLDCCLIKLFANDILEQAESSFQKNANNSTRNFVRNVQEEKTGRLHVC